jgi:hypothetical protein
VTRTALRRLVIGALLGTALTYAAALPALYAAQDNLLFPAAGSQAELPAAYEEVSLVTADGLHLLAAWRPPASGRPVAVFFHGNGDSLVGAARATEALSAAGYGVLPARISRLWRQSRQAGRGKRSMPMAARRWRWLAKRRESHLRRLC